MAAFGEVAVFSLVESIGPVEFGGKGTREAAWPLEKQKRRNRSPRGVPYPLTVGDSADHTGGGTL